MTAIEGIERSVSNKSFADFEQDWLLKHGVQRGGEIISEASRHLPQNLRNEHPAISMEADCGYRKRAPSRVPQDRRSGYPARRYRLSAAAQDFD
jgi:uncharacterized protein with HEPN domain